MSKGENGQMVLTDQELSLKELNEALTAKMRETKNLRRKFKQAKKMMKYIKTPEISEDNF